MADDNYTIDVDALLAVGIDEASVRTAINTAERFGKQFGSEIGNAAAKSLGSLSDDVNKALTGTKSKGERDVALRAVSNAYKALAKDVLAEVSKIEAAVGATGDALGGVQAEATKTSGAFRTMGAAADAALSGADVDAEAFISALKKIIPVTKGNEVAFASLSQIISSSLNKARTEFAVTEQSAQQARGLIKQQERLAYLEAAGAERARLQAQKAVDREAEQARAASLRNNLAAQKSALSQQNSAFNASLQSQLVQEKGFQQRRTALIQSGLLATRSLYQSFGSGVSGAVRGAYSLIQAATRSGEDQATAINRKGLNDRKLQTESIMRQTVAVVRKEQGTIAAAQTQLDQGGVLGAVTGQSRAGALLRGGAFGAGAIGGALGIKQLTSAASDFESNLRIFAVLNDELQQTPALMDDVRQTALDLGRDVALPGVSAGDAAAAITALAKTGLDLDDSLGAAKGSLLLASQAGIDFSESARTIGSTLNALKLEGEDATKVVDGFTTALKLGGGATFDELRLAQSQSLLVFRQAFKGAEEPLDIMNNLNASLALFSKNALRGSDAGTSLKTFISSLQGLSDKSKKSIESLVQAADQIPGVGPNGEGFGGGNFLFTEAGRARTFAETIDLIKVAFRTLDPKERSAEMRQIFGSDAIRAAEIFFNTQEDEIANLVAELQRSTGITEKLAQAKNQGLRAAADAFVSTIETIYIASFKKLDIFFGNVIIGISSAIDALFFSPALKGLRGALIGIGAALASVVAAKAAIEVFQLLKIAVAALATPLGVVTLALSAVGAAIGFVLAQSEPLREALGRVFDNLKSGAWDAAKGPLVEIAVFFKDLKKDVERAAEVVGFFITLLIDDDIRERFIEWQKLDPSVEKEGIFGWFLKLRKEIPNLIKTVVDTFQEVVSFIGKVATDPAFETFRKTVLGVAAGVAAVLVGIKALGKARAGIAALQAVGAVFTALTSPLGLAIVGIGLLGGALFALYAESKPFRDLVNGLVELVKDLAGIVIKAAMPAIKAFADIVKGAASTALKVFLEGFETVVAFLGSDGFVGVLVTVGEIVGKVVVGIATAFSKLVGFITALARTIKELGIFEGLRQGAIVVFEGLVDVVGGVLGSIGKKVKETFDGINWPQVAAAAAAGIFKFFQTIGRTVGTFLGSKEFLTTVVTALGIIAGALASAATGLVSGFIEGLYKSDAGDQVVEFFKELIGLGVDEIGGAGDAIAGALRQATLDGLTLALSVAFPPELFRRLLTDPLGSALGAAVLVVEALFIGKIVGLFITGFAKIKTAAAGFQLIGTVLGGGLGAANAQLDKTKKKADESAATLQRISGQYGGFTASVAKAADGVQKFGDRGKATSDVAQTFAKNVDGQTAALFRNEAAAKANVGTARDVRKGLEEAGGAASGTSAAFTALSDKYTSMVATIAGGAAGGAGLGTALTADNPLGVISGITAAIGGIGTVAVTTASVVASAGITAGLLTGGVGLAVFAITSAITFLISNKSQAEAAAGAVAAASESYIRSFSQILDATNGSRAKTSLEFFKRLNDTGSSEFKEFRDAINEFGFDMQGAASAVTGTEDAYDAWAKNVTTALDSVTERAQDIRNQLDNDPTLLVPAGGGGVEFEEARARREALLEELSLLENRESVLKDSLSTIEGTRAAYQDAIEVSAQDLLIMQNLKAVELERKALVEQNLDLRRSERDVLSEITQKIIDIIALEDGRLNQDRDRAERGATRSFANTVVPTVGSDGAAVAAEGDLSGFLSGKQTEEADAARDAIIALQNEYANTAAVAAQNAESYSAFVQTLGLEQSNLISSLIAEGVDPAQAEAVANVIFQPMRDQAIFTAAAVSEIGDSIDTLGLKIRNVDFSEITASINIDDAEEAVNRFLADPKEADIPVLLDLGVPASLLEEFVKNPTPKTMQLVVDSVNATADVEAFVADGFLDEKEITALAKMGVAEDTLRGFLADGFLDQKEIDALITQVSQFLAFATIAELTKPETKPIVLELDPASVQRVTNQIARGVGGVPYSNDWLEVATNNDINGNGFIGSKYGRIITEPTLSWLGEERRKEVVIPLTMPNRAAQLYEQSGMASVLAKAGVAAPGVHQAAAVSTGPSRNEFDRVVGELQMIRSDLREDMDTRRDNVFLMEGVQDPYPTARQTASKLRQRRRRR